MKKRLALIVLLFFACFQNALALEYTYDALDRLTRVNYDNGDSISYQYDPAGNITDVITTTTTKTLTVISPNGGEIWQAGTAQTIRWSSTGDLGKNVTIELYRDTTFDRTLVTSTPNNGAYIWNIPDNLDLDSTYRVKIIPLNDVTSSPVLAYADYSDAHFSINNQPAVLSSVVLTGPSQIDENSTASFTATASFSDGSSQVISDSASWNEDSTICSIHQGILEAGSVSADSVVTISVSYTHEGVTKTDAKDVTIKNVEIPKTLISLTISGASILNENSTGSYVAKAGFSDGSTVVVTDTAVWSEDSPYTTVNNGLLNAQEVPTDQTVILTVEYTYGVITRQASKTVTIKNVAAPRTLTSISLSGPATIWENSSAQYTATAQYNDGTSEVVNNKATWSENSPHASITAGLLKARSVHADTPVTITAEYTHGNITRQTSKTITIKNIAAPRTLTSISLSGPSTIRENSSAQYTATARYNDGTSEVVNTKATWSEDSEFASISQNGRVRTTSVTQDSHVRIKVYYTYGTVTKAASKDVIIREGEGQHVRLNPAIPLLLLSNRNDCGSECGETILFDTFDEYNSDNWGIYRNDGLVPDTDAAKVEGSILKIIQDRTDNGPLVFSKVIPADRPIKITRRVKAHSHISYSYMGGDEFFVGGFAIYSTDTPLLTRNVKSNLCHITHADYEYQVDVDGFYLGPGFTEPFLPSIWDEWFVEEITYNPQTGYAKYAIGNNEITANCQVNDGNYLKIGMHSYGWWTGHYEFIDWIKIATQ